MNSDVAIIKTNNYKYSSLSECLNNQCSELEQTIESLFEYEMIKDGLLLLGFDKGNANSSSWNPFKELIKKGMTVLIKPNMVMDKNHIEMNGTACLYTQPSLVACILLLVVKALQGDGRIIIGDAPMQECDFEQLIKTSGYSTLLEKFKKYLSSTHISVELVDFRGLTTKRINGINHSRETGEKGVIVNLGKESEFSEESAYSYENMRITNYDPRLLKQHHSCDLNEYCVSKYLLDADVVINMPKPKTHRKAGVTCALKNMVGINCRKEYLPHHTNGSVPEGGDEYESKSKLKHLMDLICDKRNYYMQTTKSYKKVWFLNKCYAIATLLGRLFFVDDYYEGSWYGNDTISKTVVDLNKILFYADKKGTLQKERQRRYFIVADMIVSGEKEGPVAPTAKNTGIVALGTDPVCFDEVIMRLMGAKIESIPTLKHARSPLGSFVLSTDVPLIVSNDEKINGKNLKDLEQSDLLFFEPTSGWRKVFERNSNKENRK